MLRTNLSKLFVGEDYSISPETSADIEAKVIRSIPITTTQRDAIGSPESGMEIYNGTTNQFEFYNGTVWSAS